MSESTSPPTYTNAHIRAAWAVHGFTATGTVVGMAGLHSVIGGDARAAILWLIAAMLLDGVDGPIARKLDVHKRIPTLDGNALDLVIDFFTCTIIPVAFLDKFDVVPHSWIPPIAFVILSLSALWMARTDQETPDRWFRGFPAEWNVIIPTLYLAGLNRWINLAVCIVFCTLMVTRVPFPHPVSVKPQRAISLTFMTLWIGSMTWLAIAGHPITWLRWILIVSPGWTVIQIVRRVISDRHVDDRMAPGGGWVGVPPGVGSGGS